MFKKIIISIIIVISVLMGAFLWRSYRFDLTSHQNIIEGFQIGSVRPTTPQETILLGQKLDINIASASDLEVLPGIGPSLAKRIVEYRNAHGPFTSIEELDSVNGVGPKILERLKIYLKL